MRTAIILNGISFKKKSFLKNIVPIVQRAGACEIFETRSRNDATILASKAVDKRFDLILAAGGDGTLHQVVNGVVGGREKFQDLPVVGVYPIGTGNDFARCIQVEPDPDQLQLLLQKFSPKTIDVGKVSYSSRKETLHRYFINVADAGMGPEVVQRVLNNGRPFGSAFAYYEAILRTFLNYRPMEVEAKADTWRWKGKLRTLAIANGKFYGHNLCIAPEANPSDGQLESFICGNVSVLDFIRYSNTLKKGKVVNHSLVSYNRTTAIQLTSQQSCAVEADGEWLGWLPATIEMTPIKLKFLRP